MLRPFNVEPFVLIAVISAHPFSIRLIHAGKYIPPRTIGITMTQLCGKGSKFTLNDEFPDADMVNPVSHPLRICILFVFCMQRFVAFV